MQPLSPSIVEALPEECLMAIVDTIEPSLPSLHPLLLTCRALFRIGAAALYRNPFDLLEQDKRFDNQERIARQRKLLHLLLSCLDEATLARLPPYQTNLISLPRQPTIDYLANYSRHSSRNFDYALTPGSSGGGVSGNSNSLGAITSTSGGTTRRQMTSGVGGIPPPPFATSLAEARHAVHLALLSHTPSHIRTLVFSFRHIASLQPLVTKLSALSRIEVYSLQQQVKTPVDGAIQFITAHRKAFPSTLEEIKLDVATTSIASSGSSSALVKVIQAMENPHLIDVTGWPGAVQHLSQFPAKDCRVLLTRQGTRVFTLSSSSVTAAPSTATSQQDQQGDQLVAPSPSPPATMRLSEVVATFSKLESIRITVNEPEFFAWARAQKEESSSRLPSQMTGACRSSMALRHVRLDGFNRYLIPSLVDVTRSFEGTLETLTAMSWFDNAFPLYLKTSPPSLNASTTMTEKLAWQWTLPRLHTIDLEGSIAIRFDYSSLQYCPSVTHLRLNIGRKIPEDWDPLEDALTHIVRVPRLRSLDLSGYWDLTDELLQTVLVPGLTDRLQRLNLMWCRGPGVLGIEAVVRGIRALKWFGVSQEMGLERDEILSMRQVLGLDDLEIDII